MSLIKLLFVVYTSITLFAQIIANVILRNNLILWKTKPKSQKRKVIRKIATLRLCVERVNNTVKSSYIRLHFELRMIKLN